MGQRSFLVALCDWVRHLCVRCATWKLLRGPNYGNSRASAADTAARMFPVNETEK